MRNKEKYHFLKTWIPYFQDILDGTKTFEYRKDDRDYQKGDVLILAEYKPGMKCYTKRFIYKQVGSCLYGGTFGVPEGYVVMSLLPYDTENIEKIHEIISQNIEE